MHQCKENQFCGNPEEYGISLKNDGVYDNAGVTFGIATFDNIFKSLFTMF